jgi:GxxExxY protein
VEQHFGRDDPGARKPWVGLINCHKEAQKSQKETNTMRTIMELCDIVRETGFAIHKYHRHGYSEKIYENALVHRLRKQGLDVKQQHPIQVFDEDGTLLGDFYADLFVENQLVVELKAVRDVIDEHVAQLLGYLRASRIEHGLLVNFGAGKFQIKKYILNELADQI